MMQRTEYQPRTHSTSPVDFLWLELTNQCNLRCTHCYAESGPDVKDVNRLTSSEQVALIGDAYDLGCRRVQLIGGEPTISKDLPRLIEHAQSLGYDLIEVYTNLVHLPDDLLLCFVEHEICVATSVYSDKADSHDAVTRTHGSFRKTIANLRKVVSAGLPVRVSVIEVPGSHGEGERTARFLNDDVGIQDVRIAPMRPFGRAEAHTEGGLADLCGSCASGTLCVSPDGEVAPCIMSKRWSVGSVRTQTLAELAQSVRLAHIRQAIRDAAAHAGKDKDHSSGDCAPNVGCPPLNVCGPDLNKITLHRGKTTTHAWRPDPAAR
ncbi:MAG: radical SAM/SPASM domain-containing protein [Pseudomonadota bacterium]